MRDNAAQLLNILSQDKIGVISLIEFNWNSNYYYTDYGTNLTWNSRTYIRRGPIASIDPVRYSNVVDRESFRFSMSALDTNMQAEVAAGITHMPVKMRLLFTVDGVPQLGIYESLEIYNGLVSKVDKRIDKETQLYNVECTAPLFDLDAIGTLFTTKDGISAMDPTDTSFDLIQEGSEAFSLKWGRG